jgi:glutamate N-acetyltransferase / amino-acid N-acetyltransferase
MDVAQGAITYPRGFVASGVCAGIKEQGKDIALVFSETPAVAAALFTTNVVKAAPVLVSKARASSGVARAVVANSGNANACTGEQGMRDALAMAAAAAKALRIPEEEVFVASTGIIGHHLPMDKIAPGIQRAVDTLSHDGGVTASYAIMTTDTKPKEASVEALIGGVPVRIGAMAKGVGMLCPNVATMLAFIATDAVIGSDALRECLMASAEVSFNSLTVDGDTSTNDSVFMLANGQAGNPRIEPGTRNFDIFREALDFVTIALAKQIAADGEGATKSIEIMVRGTDTFDSARRIAKSIANSPLVKTAMFGNDPNWGRIMMAAGKAGVDFDPHAANLYFGDNPLVCGGEPVAFDESAMHELLRMPEVKVLLEVGSGPGQATVWTCDFSYDYVKINAEYHT